VSADNEDIEKATTDLTKILTYFQHQLSPSLTFHRIEPSQTFTEEEFTESDDNVDDDSDERKVSSQA